MSNQKPDPQPIANPTRPVLRWGVFVLAFVLGILLDLGTKEFAFHHLPEVRDTHVVFSWFSWTHARNYGAAFSMFEGQQGLFMAMTILAFVGLPYFVHVAEEKVVRTALIMGLVLAGVGGNFWDRMVFGYVRDFIDVHAAQGGWLFDFTRSKFGTATWPTFNVADMFITGGCFAVFFLLGSKKKEEEGAADAPETADSSPDDGSSQAPASS
ncbi:MAG: signal peptidase II [Planctomycetes bacterium]|nr:signal peptidase II [Planctomycetota bacterium]